MSENVPFIFNKPGKIILEIEVCYFLCGKLKGIAKANARCQNFSLY